jgi:hypothetical protein
LAHPGRSLLVHRGRLFGSPRIHRHVGPEARALRPMFCGCVPSHRVYYRHSMPQQKDLKMIRSGWKEVARQQIQRDPYMKPEQLLRRMQNPITMEKCSDMPSGHECRKIGIRSYIAWGKGSNGATTTSWQQNGTNVATHTQNGSTRSCSSSTMDRSGWTNSACQHLDEVSSPEQLQSKMTNFMDQPCTQQPVGDDCYQIAMEVWHNDKQKRIAPA